MEIMKSCFVMHKFVHKVGVIKMCVIKSVTDDNFGQMCQGTYRYTFKVVVFVYVYIRGGAKS